MISYMRAKKDLDQMILFNNAVIALWEIENSAESDLDRFDLRMTLISHEKKEAIIAAANRNPQYQQKRQDVSKLVLKAIRIAARHRIPTEFKSIPPPAVGGAIIPVNVFYSVLNDNSYQGVSKQMVFDALNQTIGACESQIDEEFWKLLNPINWVKELLKWILRIPFMLIELSGFDVEKVEDHFLGKLFKIIEVVVIVWALYGLGVQRTELATFVKDFFAAGK